MALFTQFGDNDVIKEINISKIWKTNSRIGFDILKMQMAGSAEVSAVAWSPYITLKLF